MKRRDTRRRDHSTTDFVLLETGKCTACWKCIETCTNNVIGRINLPFHKHVRIISADKCTGCLKCVKICESGAFSRN